MCREVCKMYTSDVEGNPWHLSGAPPFISFSRALEGPGTSSGTDPEFHSLWSFWLETLENSARYGEELVSSAGFNCRSGSFAIIRKLNGDRLALDIIIVVVSVTESLFWVGMSDL
jgi:hypothetical protein